MLFLEREAHGGDAPDWTSDMLLKNDMSKVYM